MTAVFPHVAAAGSADKGDTDAAEAFPCFSLSRLDRDRT